MSLLTLTALGIGICVGGSAAADVTAALPQDDTQQTKYDITIRNDTSSALSGFSSRVYFDIAELIAAGLDASQVRCDERYDPSGAGTCSVAQFNGNTYYAELRFGTLSLAAGASIGYKITLRLADWSRRWSSANDYSRVGLSSTATVTARLPVYQGATRISGTDPGSGTPGPVPAPTFAPAPGIYSSAQSVTIGSSISGATIRYTTGSANPSCSSGTVYSGPLAVSSSTTLRAIGCVGSDASPVAVGAYSISFNIPASAVSASADDGNVPANTVDGNLATRWSANGDGQWIRYDLGSTVSVNSISIAWYSGDSRAAIFEVQTSTDGTAFMTRYSGQSSGASTALESYGFPDVSARYVRILGHGNTANTWNSIAETRIFGTAAGGTVDNQAPTAPSNLQAQAVSSSRIDLTWNASSDNVGVSGYRVYRDSTLVASPASTSFSDTNRAASTAYTYAVRAIDAAGNLSAASAQVSEQTQAASGGCSGALSSAASIQSAMLSASPGTVILIAPGTYTGNRATSGDPRVANGLPLGVFYSGRSGTPASPIVLKGCDPDQPAVLRGSADNDGSYGLHLTGDYWKVRDIAVQDAQKGIMLDNANRNHISGVTVHDVGDEAVHFRDGSSYNVFEHSRIYNTGGYQPQFGEGVYVGSDGGTSTYEHTVVDNVIRHVHFDAGITAEHLDVKEGATGTIIEYNDFNGTGISGENSADSFIDIKGINSIVRFNTGRRNGNSNVVDAFQVRTHGSCCLTGANNRFNDNSVDLDGIGSGGTNGYAIFATSQTSATTSTNDRRTDGNPNIYNSNVNE